MVGNQPLDSFYSTGIFHDINSLDSTVTKHMNGKSDFFSLFNIYLFYYILMYYWNTVSECDQLNVEEVL